MQQTFCPVSSIINRGVGFSIPRRLRDSDIVVVVDVRDGEETGEGNDCCKAMRKGEY